MNSFAGDIAASSFSRLDPVTDAGNADTLVRLVDVRRRFGATTAIDGISLVARRGEVLGIIGRSGAGKSTLIRCLNGLEKPDSGEIWVDGREISRLSEGELLPLRRRIGMIFQHFNLLSAKTVEENVGLPLKIAGRSSTERRKRVAELLDLVGLSAKAKAFPSALSGGQKQRVGIARALAAEPTLLLSDEATSALDPETTRSILDLLKTINRDLGVTIVLITHEMEVIRGVADRVIVLDKGRIVEQGPVWAVFAAPKDATTTSLLTGIRPQLPIEIAARLSAAKGTETVLSVDIVGSAAQQLVFSDLALAFSGSYRVLHGGIDHVQGQPIGRFFIGVTIDAATPPSDLADFLRSRSAHVEVLGHV